MYQVLEIWPQYEILQKQLLYVSHMWQPRSPKNDCNESTFKLCVNCQGSHPAFSKSCMQYKKEQLIVKMKFKEGLSYKAAVSKLKQTGELTPYNYKKALESKNTPTMSTPKIPKLTTENKFNVLQM